MVVVVVGLGRKLFWKEMQRAEPISETQSTGKLKVCGPQDVLGRHGAASGLGKEMGTEGGHCLHVGKRDDV